MKLALFIALCMVIAAAARAQTYEEAKACVADAFRLCKAEASSSDMAAIKSCLTAHRNKVSYRCRETLRKHGA